MNGPPLRVAVFNDSSTMRGAIRAALAPEEDIRIVAERDHAEDAPAVVRECGADVVIMDVVMPGVDGYQATRAIMDAYPTPIVMVSSVVDPRDQDVIFAAIAAGALHIAEPPPAPATPDYAFKRVAFVELVRTIAGARVRDRGDDPARPAAEAASPVLAVRGPIDAIGIVASAGGPQAIVTLLEGVRAGVLPPIVLVQHLAAGFTASFARWLSSTTGHHVEVAAGGEEARRGTIYVAPEDRHVWVDRRLRLVVDAGPRRGGFRPSGDVLLARLSESLGQRALGVILSGMGRDGAEGAVALHRAGGGVVAQALPAIDGMPASAAATGAVDAVLPIQQIGRWLEDRSMDS